MINIVLMGNTSEIKNKKIIKSIRSYILTTYPNYCIKYENCYCTIDYYGKECFSIRYLRFWKDDGSAHHTFQFVDNAYFLYQKVYKHDGRIHVIIKPIEKHEGEAYRNYWNDFKKKAMGLVSSGEIDIEDELWWMYI